MNRQEKVKEIICEACGAKKPLAGVKTFLSDDNCENDCYLLKKKVSEQILALMG